MSDQKTRYSGKPMSEESLKEHLKAFSDIEECVAALYKDEKKAYTQCTEVILRGDDYIGCQNEQQFKMKWLKINKLPNLTQFCIETEETVKGFPDVMFIDNDTKQAQFAEFKFTKTGKIKFQPTQPAFYKKYHHLPIRVIAYNAKTNTVHFIMKEDLFRDRSIYKLNEKAEVDLCKAEKEKI